MTKHISLVTTAKSYYWIELDSLKEAFYSLDLKAWVVTKH